MSLLAAILIVTGIALITELCIRLFNSWLDGWEERRDARRRNQAHRR